jgi:putative phosphoserine phosphatase/1-acylglycerol-3-phosphate O-acyltransferase
MAVAAAACGPLIVLSGGWLRDPLLAVVMPWFARATFALAGVAVEVRGAEHVASRAPRVLVLNHSSTLDLLVMALIAPSGARALVKRELMWVPPVNLALWLVGTIFVDRSDPASSIRALERAADDVRAHGLTLMIAPEGTRSRTGALGAFKKGPFHLAQRAGAEIVPVVIEGAHTILPPSGWLVRAGRLRVTIRPPEAPPTDPTAAAASLEARYRGWLAAD